LGESEVREVHHEKAAYLCQIGDKEKAAQALTRTFEKTVGSGGKLDVLFTTIRLGIFWDDDTLVASNLEKAKGLIEQGGDWDRRNRLRTYDALYMLRCRNFKKAAQILLEIMPTFNAYEVFSFNDFIKYTVLLSMMTLERRQLKESVVDAPEVLSVVAKIPDLEPFLNALYDCDYKTFFVRLANITDSLKQDRYMSRHARYFCREMRIRAYAQKLFSYRTVQMSSMAADFGVTVEFLDQELSRFIALGHLPCRIDKVGNVVQMIRENNQSAQYQSVIKHGDVLLTRVQNLSRVINM